MSVTVICEKGKKEPTTVKCGRITSTIQLLSLQRTQFDISYMFMSALLPNMFPWLNCATPNQIKSHQTKNVCISNRWAFAFAARVQQQQQLGQSLADLSIKFDIFIICTHKNTNTLDTGHGAPICGALESV